MQRKIIHIDMDAFYASVEQRDFPEYRGKPLVVGGLPEGRGGVVATASYEARAYGIHSAMSSKRAQQLCPQAIFVRPRFAVYKEVSHAIRAIFARYTDSIEPLSLDEAYLDVTQDKRGIGSAIAIAEEIRAAIRDELHLTASAGVSVNKFVAKVASDMRKPDGLTFIGPSRVEAFMAQLPVEKFFGVGKVTAEKMKKQGLHTGADLKQLPEARLVQLFGKSGRFFYKMVRGIDERPVRSNQALKSLSAEDTFMSDLDKGEELNDSLMRIARSAFRRMTQAAVYGRTITLKVKFADFTICTRSRSLPQPLTDFETLWFILEDLLDHVAMEGRKIRLLGVAFSNFESKQGLLPAAGRQPELFDSDRF